jgi:hypothetical protein
VGAHRYVSALSAEIVGGTLPEKRFSRRYLPQRARSARANRPGDRTGGGGVYRVASRESAVMLAGIGPVKPFLFKPLIAQKWRRAVSRPTPAHAQLLRSRCDAGAASAASPAARRGRTCA